MVAKKKKAADCGVLLIAHGGPESPDEIEKFLLDIRGGRPISAEALEQVTHRYQMIGGRSPLPDITRRQAAALESLLQEAGTGCRVAVGMRHGQPNIEQGADQLLSAKVAHLIAVHMSPFHTALTAGPANKRLQEAVHQHKKPVEIHMVQGWHAHPDFLSAFAGTALKGLDVLDIGEADTRPLVIFTAHSLPVRVIEGGAPYDSHVRETGVAVAEKLKLDREDYTVAYQSAGRSMEPWLGPVLRNTIVKAANEGRKLLLIAPIGFVADNLELLYDIDIEARQAAEEHGARLERCPALNDSPELIAVLADLVQSQLPGV